MRFSSQDGFRWLAAIGFVAAFLTPVAYGQVLPKNRAPARQPAPAAPGAPGTVAPQPVAPAPGETPGQTRREGRQEARDARAGARQAGETGPQARATARETRQETRQNIQATRAADMGLWFNNRAANGLVIADLANNSVFANAGFLAGDRIVSVAGQPVTTEAQFVQFLTGPNLGTQPVQVVVFRNGQQQTLVLQPTALTQGIVTYDPLYQYGIIVDDTNPNQIIVQRVFPRTAAYYAGLRPGDVIIGLGGQQITSLNIFTQALAQANGPLALQVTRSGQTRDLQLDPSLASQDSVRTALRPNIDANVPGGTSIDGRAGAPAAGATAPARTPDSATTPARAPDSATAPARAPDSAGGRASEPNSPVAAPPPASRAPGAAPGAGGAAPGRPNPPSGTTPANPATPATPGAPGAGATPATPATPAQPGSREGAAPGTGTAPGAPATPGQPRTGTEAAPGAGTAPAAPGTSDTAPKTPR